MKPTLATAILYGGMMAAATLSAIHPGNLMMKAQARGEALAARVEARLHPAHASFTVSAVCPRSSVAVERAQIEALAQVRAAQACRRAELAQMAAALRTQIRSQEVQLALARLQAVSASWSTRR